VDGDRREGALHAPRLRGGGLRSALAQHPLGPGTRPGAAAGWGARRRRLSGLAQRAPGARRRRGRSGRPQLGGARRAGGRLLRPRPRARVGPSGRGARHLGQRRDPSLPAMVEASASAIPLVALTADRPWELHGFGAAQTMPQGGLFGRSVRASESLSIPEATSGAFRHLRAVVSRTVSAALGRPFGPVHLDVPFREPLAPVPDAPVPPGLDAEALEGRGDGPFLRTVQPAPLPPAAELEAVRRRLAAAERGVVVVGPRARADRLGTAVRALAASHGYPVLAEAASNVRWAPGQPRSPTWICCSATRDGHSRPGQTSSSGSVEASPPAGSTSGWTPRAPRSSSSPRAPSRWTRSTARHWCWRATPSPSARPSPPSPPRAAPPGPTGSSGRVPAQALLSPMRSPPSAG
jgi:hypothetical protein